MILRFAKSRKKTIEYHVSDTLHTLTAVSCQAKFRRCAMIPRKRRSEKHDTLSEAGRLPAEGDDKGKGQ